MMTNPVPTATLGTPYGKRGPYWSCNRDSSGNGIHTGCDYPAPTGTQVVAARAGKAVYCNHGSAFGYHQLEILPGDGTRDFYAHMTTRLVSDQQQVAMGQPIGKVGTEGNVTGPHLHFERHKVATGPWSCAVVTDPAPSVNAGGSAGAGSGEDDVTEDDIREIAARVVKALGDYRPDGKPQEKYADSPAEGDNRLRSISTRLSQVQTQLDKIWGKVK